MQINDPAILHELRDLHDVYERALVDNDVETLQALFWDSPGAVRYGVGECLYGADEIRAFRQGRPKIDLDRKITRLEILALGEGTGVINLEFVRSIDGIERHGRQTQFWIRFGNGWRIASAHVSLLPAAPSYADAAAARIGIPVHAGNRAAVNEDLNRIAAVAQFLMAFPLDQGVEVAPVFQA